MTISQPISSQQLQLISNFLDSNQVSEGCLDYIAVHGFLTGIATGPESLVDAPWREFMFDGEPEYLSQSQQTEIEAIVEQQSMVIQRSLYLDDGFELPCSLIAANPGETNDLSDWCFGFLEAIAIDEDSWFENPELNDAIAELILPIGIISNQFVEPELEHLSADKKVRQQMASHLVENIQNLYLLFRE